MPKDFICHAKHCERKTRKFDQVNLVSSIPGAARELDPTLINSWGLFIHDDKITTALNGSGLVSTYSELGQRLKSVNVLFNGEPAAPTGIVRNRSEGFLVTGPKGTGRSEWITVTENGTILGYSPEADPDNAITVAIFAIFGSEFKGLDQHDDLIYVANFTNNQVNVFDSTWHNITSRFAFVDPNLPVGYAPFNIKIIDDKIYIVYAVVKPDGDEQDGPGLGLVNVYDLKGNFERRLINPGGLLNGPWALLKAPDCFGLPSDHLLVGNFGDGKIHVYKFDGEFVTTLKDKMGCDLVIDRLWGLADGSRDTVFFAAGPQDEAQGLVGLLNPI
jgi:uncharacterized protein (TIGR03118 family)